MPLVFRVSIARGRDGVAVGMPVTRHPPHGSVQALLTHTVLTLDVLTQSAPPDTDAGSRLPESDVRVSPEIAPTSSGFADSAGEVATTTCAALSCRNAFRRSSLRGTAWYRKYPRTTAWSHSVVPLVLSFRRSRSCCRIFFSLAAMRLPIVFRYTWKYPV